MNFATSRDLLVSETRSKGAPNWFTEAMATPYGEGFIEVDGATPQG